MKGVIICDSIENEDFQAFSKFLENRGRSNKKFRGGKFPCEN